MATDVATPARVPLPCSGVLLITSPELMDHKDTRGRTAVDIAREGGHEEAEDALFMAADSRDVQQTKKEKAHAAKRVLQRGSSRAALQRAKTASKKNLLQGRKAPSFKLPGSSPSSPQPPSPYSRMQGGFRSVARAGELFAKAIGMSADGSRQSQSLPSTPEKRQSLRGLSLSRGLSGRLSRVFGRSSEAAPAAGGTRTSAPHYTQNV